MTCHSRTDLHLHTHASDGAFAPADVVRCAALAGMSLIAITDHDTVSGVREAVDAGRAASIEVWPGIEISSGEGTEVHLLGYGIDAGDAALDAFLAEALQKRAARGHEMLGRLRDLDMPIAYEAVCRESGFVGRMNLAVAMVSAGYVASVSEAFARYLGDGKPACVPRARPRVTEGIAVIRAAGGMASLAHPGRLRMEEATLAALLPEWIEAGLEAIEAYHPSHDRAACLHHDRMARRLGLLVTGGSDCHGRPEGAQMGDHLTHWQGHAQDIAALAHRMQTQTRTQE